jgi:2-beta-glucuronyltransferase
LAQAYHKLGYEVLFFTAPVSYLLKLKGDYRFDFALKEEAGKLVEKESGLHSYVHFTPFHIANFRMNVLNKISSPLVSLYNTYGFKEAESFIGQSDLVIFESTPGLFLFDRIKRLNTTGRFVYRVSDDLRLLNVHPALIRHEERILSRFDLVSVPSAYIYTILSAFRPGNLQLNHHGINKQIFDEEQHNPFAETSRKNIVFIGNDYFDTVFLETAATAYPEHLFHIIGPIPNLPVRENIIAYGEMPYRDTVPYVKFADAGLHTLTYRPGAESFTDSLKVLQYTYCRLPIIAPDFLKTNRKNTFCYEPGNKASIKLAIARALEGGGAPYDNSEVKSWEEVANNLWDSAKS